MTAFDDVPARKPFADLGRDIGDVNRRYAPGEHPAERRAAAQHAEENQRIYANVRPAMRSNNRLRNYMHFMHPLIQDRDNLDDDDGDAVDERYAELRDAGLANTLGGARANAMDRGEHLPQVRRDERALYRALPRGGADPELSQAGDPGMGVQGRRSLNLWQEGDPEPGSNLADAFDRGGHASMDLRGRTSPASGGEAQGAAPVQAPDTSHLNVTARRRAGGWANPLNWGWVKRMRNWFSGSSRVEAPAAGAAPEEADAPMLDQVSAMDEAEQFRPAAPGARAGGPVRGRRPMFGKLARRLSV